MAQDPMDKQLVEAVLAGRPRRTRVEQEEAKLASKRPARAGVAVIPPLGDPDLEDDDDDDDLDLELGVPADPAAAVEIGVEVVGDDGEVVAEKLPADAPAKLDAKELEEPTPGGARGPLRRHDRDRRPGPDVPQGDRQGRPADRRGRGRPGQGHRARRVARRGALEGRRLTPRVDHPRHRAQDPDRQAAAPAAAWRRGPHARPRGDRGRVGRRPARAHARLPPGQGGQGRPVGRHEDAPPRGQGPAPHVQRDARRRIVHQAPRLGLLRRPQRRPRLARQHRPAGDLRLDPRCGRVPGPRALDHGRQRRRAAQADGLRPRGAPQHQAARPRRASWSRSAATPASS